MGGCQTDGEIGDVRLLQGVAASRARLALAEVLEGARFAEQVPTLRSKARAIRFLGTRKEVPRGGGGTHVMLCRSPMAINPRTRAMSGRSTSGLH